MALPPNGLKDILGGAPEEMFDVLVQNKCLNGAGLTNRQAVIDLVRAALQECEEFYARRPGWCGPNSIDYVASALISSPYLSKRGHRLYHTDTRNC